MKPLRDLARVINAEVARPFPSDMEILAEPGRHLVATAATAVARVIGKAVRDGRVCYHIDDSVYHTFSGLIFDHCPYHFKAMKRGRTEISAVLLERVVDLARWLPAGQDRARQPVGKGPALRAAAAGRGCP